MINPSLQRAPAASEPGGRGSFVQRLSAVPPDYITTSCLLILLPLFFYWRGIPLNYEWTGFFVPYWISVSIYSMFFAILFYLIQHGCWQPLCRAFRPFTANWIRLCALLLLVTQAIWLLGFWKTLIVFANLIGGLAYLGHFRETKKDWLRQALSVFVPAVYFSVGFILIASYNVLIGSLRYYATYDPFFDSLDRVLLLGRSVTDLSRMVAGGSYPEFFLILEKTYFFMFPQIGAAIILLTVQHGVHRALRFTGTIALAYQLATFVYFCWPSLGPFFLTTPISAGLPSDLLTVSIQAELAEKLQLLWKTGTKNSIGLDFYIAFPCMHLAQPLIVLWFLKEMRRVVWSLVVYDVFMIFAIILLQWHYVVDLVGGVMVAAAVLWVHCRRTKAAA